MPNNYADVPTAELYALYRYASIKYDEMKGRERPETGVLPIEAQNIERLYTVIIQLEAELSMRLGDLMQNV